MGFGRLEDWSDARAQAAGDRRQPAAAAAAHSRRPGLRQQPALARLRGGGAAGAVRHPDVGVRTRISTRWRTACSSGSRAIRASPTSKPTSTSTSRSFRVDIDRDKVADLGLDVAVIGRTLETLLGGRAGHALRGRRRAVSTSSCSSAAEERASPETLSRIFVRSAEPGEMVQLSNLVTISETVAPKELSRFNQLRAVDHRGQPRAGLHARRGACLPRRRRRARSCRRRR